MEKYCLLKEWIFAGPFQKDVSSLYENNYNIPQKPYLSALQEMEKKMPETLHACEGEKFELFGQSAVWEQLRLEETEKKVTVAGFGTFARAMVSCACCDIIAMEPGEYRFRFYTQGIAAIAVNGEKVYSCGELGFFSCTQTFTARLRAGNNRISVFLFNVHIHCVNSFALEIVDTGKWESRAPLAPLSSDRDTVLSLLASFYLNSSLSLDGEPIFLCTDRGIPNGFSWFLCRRDRFGRRGEPLESGTILKGRTEIPITSRRGEYILCVDYTDPSGIVLKGRPLSFESESLIRDLPNEGNEKRKRFLTETYTLLEYVEDREAVYQQLACLEAGRADLFREEEVMRSVRYVNARYDCADFAIHGVLRLYAKYGTSGIFSEMLLEEMKKCILSFQYAQDENGKSMMFMRSENHAMLFYSAEYLAGLLFPKEVFSNSGQNGLFHIQKGKAGAARWIREKGTWGFSEWHSNTYYEENIISLLDIWEFGEEYDPIHHQSKALLDFICLLIASHSLKGIMAVTHGRCYEKSLIYPILEGISHINWLLFGVPDRLVGRISMGAAALLSSGYQAPEVSKRLAVSDYAHKDGAVSAAWDRRCELLCLPDKALHGLRDSSVPRRGEGDTGKSRAGTAGGEDPRFCKLL